MSPYDAGKLDAMLAHLAVMAETHGSTCDCGLCRARWALQSHRNRLQARGEYPPGTPTKTAPRGCH